MRLQSTLNLTLDQTLVTVPLCLVLSLLSNECIAKSSLNIANSSSYGSKRIQLRNKIQAAYENDKYQTVATLGLKYLDTFQYDNEIRLAVANSMAWDGLQKNSFGHYQLLLGSRYDKSARIGLANALNWSGQPGIAVFWYTSLLQIDSEHEEAKAGIQSALQAMSDSTQISTYYDEDSDKVERNGVSLSQNWYFSNGKHKVILKLKDQNIRREQLRVSNKIIETKWNISTLYVHPQLKLSVQTEPREIWFAGLNVRVGQSLVLSFDKLNWGELSFTPESLNNALTAQSIAIDVHFFPYLSQFSMSLKTFRISDKNEILELNGVLDPHWAHFGKMLKVKFNLYGYESRNDAPDYWTPSDRYLILTTAVEWEWHTDNWDLETELGWGIGVNSETDNSVNGAIRLERRFTNNWQLKAEVYKQRSMRESPYKLKSANLVIEKRW